MATARVFPRRTKATPEDAMAFIGDPPLFLESVDRVLVSCVFTWDIGECRRLRSAWQFRFPEADVQIGGPAFNDPGGEFEPGLFLKPGYVFTSRGCPNRCPRCMVPDREGAIRTLTIRDGHDLLDNNLLACPESHIYSVLDMLLRQQAPARFTGGLEAKRLTEPLAKAILAIKPAVLYFAYDRPGEKQHVADAFSMVRGIQGASASWMRHHVGCYILCGYEGDTLDAAKERIDWVIGQDVQAFPMYFRDEQYSSKPQDWSALIAKAITFGAG